MAFLDEIVPVPTDPTGTPQAFKQSMLDFVNWAISMGQWFKDDAGFKAHLASVNAVNIAEAVTTVQTELGDLYTNMVATAASVNLPAITSVNAGRAVTAKADGTGWELSVDKVMTDGEPLVSGGRYTFNVTAGFTTHCDLPPAFDDAIIRIDLVGDIEKHFIRMNAPAGQEAEGQTDYIQFKGLSNIILIGSADGWSQVSR